MIYLDAKWIFFDVGSTLVDETEAYNHRAREMIENTDITFSVFDEKRIELAGCQLQNAVMVGDRLDNDIIPAKALGMKTVWIRKGLSIYQNIDLGKNIAEWVIATLSDLKVIFS